MGSVQLTIFVTAPTIFVASTTDLSESQSPKE
jgi:hypothetical protein